MRMPFITHANRRARRELSLIARELNAHLAIVPFVAGALY
jgi:hypothetical protein